MKQMNNTFVKKIKKLGNYFILREENEYLILGTTVNIKEHIEIHTTFSVHMAKKDRNFKVFFILEMEECAETNEFRKNELPILTITKDIVNSKIEMIKEKLDDFVNTKK